MSGASRPSLLEEEIRLLVKFFGVERVQAALSKAVADRTVETPNRQSRRQPADPNRQAKSSITSTLEQIRPLDGEKHRLLVDFYIQLKDRKILTESQDIRYFAQNIGLKEITGKSRKDMIPNLMRHLVEQPTSRLRSDIETASSISEQQRQQGFSVLTDKLMGDNKGKKG